MTILANIAKHLDTSVAPTSNYINVMTDSVLQCAFRAFRRRTFTPSKRLNVIFVDADDTGEGAVDDGGPTREFLRLLVIALKDSHFFCGPEDARNLALLSTGMDICCYF